MFKIFSRKNRINKAPVNKPNSFFGFLCLMAIKSLCTREKAGAIFLQRRFYGLSDFVFNSYSATCLFAL